MPTRDEYQADLQNRANQDPVTKTVANFPETQKVEADALPLPSGASTEATLAALKNLAATEATLAAFKAAVEALIHAGSLLVIEAEHEKIHDGELFDFCAEIQSLADAATLDYLLTVDASACHLTWQIDGDSAYRVELFEGPTVTADGTAQSINDRNRQTDNSPLTTLHLGPTLTDDGTRRCVQRQGIAGNNARTGGSAREGNEWVLAPSTLYLLRITSLSGGGEDLNGAVKISFYEVA